MVYTSNPFHAPRPIQHTGALSQDINHYFVCDESRSNSCSLERFLKRMLRTLESPSRH